MTYFNIYHFHLGDKTESLDDEFSLRTGNLLFVYINNKEAFILGVYPHKDWIKNKWFNILYLNWSEECRKFQLNGFSSEENRSEKDIEELRKNYINKLIKIGDKTFFLPGFAVTTNGNRLDDVKSIGFTTVKLDEIKEYIRNNFFDILKKYSFKKKYKLYLKKLERVRSLKISIKEIEGNKINLSWQHKDLNFIFSFNM